MSICLKLYKPARSGMTTVHIYNYTDSMIVCDAGTVGTRLKQTKQKVAKGAATDAAVRKLGKPFKDKGFKPIPDSKLRTVIVQYPIDIDTEAAFLDRQERLMDMLDELLGVTGNGHVDGCDLGSGTSNIFLMTVDPELAAKGVQALLKKKKLIADATIAIARGRTYDVTYPKGRDDAFGL
ncbi:MAG: hypothetical protein JSR77_16955 [Planctomycetes bacterium]|nr:hypothetical protein [Planctomycetota bacterium]